VNHLRYSTILADDLTGNGKLDILITTIKGSVFCIETEASYDALNTWTSEWQGRNGVTSRYHQGIRISEETRHLQDISGNTITLTFEIVDYRKTRGNNAHYSVTVWRGSNILAQESYKYPGFYEIHVDCPHHLMSSTLKLEMKNENGQSFYDSFSVGFNLHFYRTLKWILVLPLVGMFVVLLFVKEMRDILPS